MISLCAEIPDDIRVCVGRSEELHFTFCNLYALGQNSLHCYMTAIKVAPEVIKEAKHVRAFNCIYDRMAAQNTINKW